MTRYKPAIVLKKFGGRWERVLSKSLIKEIKEDVTEDDTEDKRREEKGIDGG